MNDNLSLGPDRAHDEPARRPIIDKGTLIPIGVVVALVFVVFQAAAQWTTLQLRVLQLEGKTEKHERIIDTQNAAMVFWRREVERKIGPLPDFKPGNNENAPPSSDGTMIANSSNRKE